MFFCRKLIRTCVVGGLGLGLAGGAVAMVAGPQRAAALLSQAQQEIHSRIDNQIDDPVAIRSQLRKLEAEYPERISQLTGDMAELNQQIGQLERERSISAKVVELADRDLGQIEEQLASLRAQGGAALASTAVRFDDREYAYDKAVTRAGQIRQTRAVYSSRAADADRDLGYLRAQAERLSDALVQLETERSQFQAQLWQIERQVDAIARNERLIEMMEKRQKALDEHDRYEASSLENLTGRLAEVRSRQEAELELLANDQQQVSYEDLARMQIEDEGRSISAPESIYSERGFELAPVMR
ncbi:hypothetical protein [Engelhardtia mirabilis]|uniref:Chromosome partition protein Smc n=1 Tax=Engelhardtia mirabilis TaxID=2528011 RepID=A0A518BFP9_9BACT|nr:hypothetical protein Pla133_08760 [Planctomycetes bacterium Pla133]QDV00136.1 hypothetical protein Pla86_08750 [Planctomycetes bacterium Pla86]